MRHEWTHKHPLDAVESALVDASNSLQESMPDIDRFSIPALPYVLLDQAIDAALRLAQSIIRHDTDPPDPRD